MRIVFLLLYTLCFLSSSAQEYTPPAKYGLSFNMDFLIRSDDLDREGLGVVAGIGMVRYISETFRLSPSIEYSAYKWEQDDVFNKYVAVNLLAQYDLLNFGKYDIPIGGGLVLDFAKKDDGNLRLRPVSHFYGTNRITMKRNWALEFLSFGLSMDFRGFFALKVTYFRLEKKF